MMSSFARIIASILFLTFSLSAQANKKIMVFVKDKGVYSSLNTQIQSRMKSNTPQAVIPLLGTSVKAMQVVKSFQNIGSFILEDMSDKDIQTLKTNRNVLAVDTEVKRPLPFPIEAFQRKTLSPTAKMNALVSLTPWGIFAVKAPEAWNDSMGGAGSRVLILDTGVDRDHPSLRGNLEQGKNFVEDSLEGYAYRDTIGHGTHVAGTIAGIMDSTGFSGVAPKAHFLAGRVCAEDGCSNFAIAAGIDWGVEQKVDVISMSLGGAWSTPAEQAAIQKAYAAGVTIVAASGNDGTNSVSYPAALPESIAVGAVDSQLKKAPFSQFGPELAVVAPGVDVVSSVPMGKGRAANVAVKVADQAFEVVKSSSFQGGKVVLTAETHSVVAAGLGKEEDFANIDVVGKVALIQRGEIKFSEKVNNAIQAKAAGVLIYNNTDGLLQGSLVDDGSELPVGVYMIEQKVGESLKAALDQGQEVTTNYQTLVTNYDSYNGTSMATPHVSGVVALIKAANKNLTPAQVKEILQKTATPLAPNENNELGAGLVNAQLAVRAAKTY